MKDPSKKVLTNIFEIAEDDEEEEEVLTNIPVIAEDDEEEEGGGDEDKFEDHPVVG